MKHQRTPATAIPPELVETPRDVIIVNIRDAINRGDQKNKWNTKDPNGSKTYPTAAYSNSRLNLGSNISRDASNNLDTNDNRVLSNFANQEASNVVFLTTLN